MTSTEPLKTGFRGSQDLLVTQVLTGYLSGNEHSISDASDGLADHVFGTVHFRRVDEVGALLDSPPQGFDPAAISPNANPDLGHHYSHIAECFYFHGVSSPCRDFGLSAFAAALRYVNGKQVLRCYD
jgi:hypothetical protein